MSREFVKDMLRRAIKYQALANQSPEGSYLRGRHHGVVDACYQSIASFYEHRTDMKEVGKEQEVAARIAHLRLELEQEEERGAINALLMSSSKQGMLKEAARFSGMERGEVQNFKMEYTAKWEEKHLTELIRTNREIESRSQQQQIRKLTEDKLNEQPTNFKFNA